MPIWLAGAGRSDADLARLIEESNGGKDTAFRYRRSHDRYELKDAHGELLYTASRTPCQVLEMSVGGCSIQTEKPFRPGALAPIELVVPFAGMVLHIRGLTQWMKRQDQIGIRFSHVNAWSESQVGRLIDFLRGQSTVESLQESIASQKLNPAIGNVLALHVPVPSTSNSEAEKIWRYDALVHGGAGRLRAPKEHEWPVVLRSTNRRFHHRGSLLDLSLGGCTAQTDEPFVGDIADPVELIFDIEGLRFLMSATTQVIYDDQILGIRFNSVGDRKREQLALLLNELCAAAKTHLEFR